MRRVAACVPAPAFTSGHENSPATLDNLPNWPRIVTSRTHRIQGSEQVLSGHNGEHSEPEVEHVLHLVVGHTAGAAPQSVLRSLSAVSPPQDTPVEAR